MQHFHSIIFQDLKYLNWNSITSTSFPGGSDGKVSASSVRDLGRSMGGEDPLEKEMATHSSILAWKIP